MACIPFSLLGAYICFRWAIGFVRGRVRIVSFGVMVFLSEYSWKWRIDHARCSCGCVGSGGLLHFWIWLRKPGWWKTIYSGIVLGLAELAKTTLIAFYLLWPLMWVLVPHTRPSPNVRARLGTSSRTAFIADVDWRDCD